MPATTNNNTAAAAIIPQSIEVIDPCNRTGKITVPKQYVHETRGVTEHRPRDAKDLSLCLLFQKGRCNAGARCHQVHVDSAFVNKLRAQATAGKACCALHGDFNSANLLSMNKCVEVSAFGSNAVQTYSIMAFGRTSAMDTLVQSANPSKNLRVNANKICRLHSQNRCKFGKDCKNIHLCADAKPISEPPALTGFKTVSTASPTPLSSRASSGIKLDVSKQELETLSSTCGLSTAPGTPDNGKSNLSLSDSMASAVSSPGDSPKEFGLLNRTNSPAPIQKPNSPIPCALEPLSLFGTFDSIWSVPLAPVATCTTASPFHGFPRGHESTIQAVAADLAQVQCSPVYSPNWA